MLDDFLKYVVEQLESLGLGRVILGFVGLIGAAGALSLFFGSAVVTVAIVIVVALVLLTLVVAFLSDYKKTRIRAGTHERLVQDYCDVVEATAGVKLDIKDWHQMVKLDRRGNAIITRRITLKPRDARLHFLRLSLEYYGADSQSERLRRKVRCTAQRIEVSGKQGARWDYTKVWRSERKHELLIHFKPAIDPGTEVTVQAGWRWPLYSVELMNGGFEDFDVRFAFPVTRAEHVVELAAKKASFNVSPQPPQLPVDIQEGDDRWTVGFVVYDCEPALRYSVRIDKTRL